MMARALTGGIGVAAWAAPCPPPALVVPLAPRLRSVVAVAEETALMARASTGGVGCVARWPTRRQVASALQRGRLLAPPPALVVPLAPRLRSVVAVAEEESALIACTFLGGVGRVARSHTRRQVASALRRGRPLTPPPPRSSSPWRRDCGSLSMSIFATVFSHLFYQLCY